MKGSDIKRKIEIDRGVGGCRSRKKLEEVVSGQKWTEVVRNEKLDLDCNFDGSTWHHVADEAAENLPRVQFLHASRSLVPPVFSPSFPAGHPMHCSSEVSSLLSPYRPYPGT